MDLSNSVIIPRENFVELEEAAWNQPTPTVKERALTTVQTTLVFGGIAAAVTAGTWGWAKGVNWLEQKRSERAIAEMNHRSTK